MNWICQIFRRKKKSASKFEHYNNFDGWSSFERELFTDINQYREENNLPHLIADRFCREQARIRTAYCIYREKITHDQMGVAVENGRRVGLSKYKENLAFGFATIGGTLDAWIESDGHNRNLLSNSLYVGIFSEIDENLKRYTVFCVFSEK